MSEVQARTRVLFPGGGRLASICKFKPQSAQAPGCDASARTMSAEMKPVP
jgi:hypothetical protein